MFVLLIKIYLPHYPTVPYFFYVGRNRKNFVTRALSFVQLNIFVSQPDELDCCNRFYFVKIEVSLSESAIKWCFYSITNSRTEETTFTHIKSGYFPKGSNWHLAAGWNLKYHGGSQ
jgi:hypothetical protein